MIEDTYGYKILEHFGNWVTNPVSKEQIKLDPVFLVWQNEVCKSDKKLSLLENYYDR